ncbi:MAG: hypothetical protein GWP60_10275 [Gammaproteobacteria bacterium]|jgi:hypothetical protein|nr:hypothetical protein [Gammaproteobacteria bacterium]
MRFLFAALALSGAEAASAHTRDTGFLSNLGHQLTSLHHAPAAMFLGVLLVVLALVAIRNRETR